MACCATRPIIYVSERLIFGIARLIPLPRNKSEYLAVLTVGPLFGSFITEPAAMTVTALVLKELYFTREVSSR